jgi:hypothetical protein
MYTLGLGGTSVEDRMSLVGNLEDLSLGDILQIISMSQKFGVLALDSERGSGRIVFSSGLVRGACLKRVDGHFCDLRALVVGKGILDAAGFDACEVRASDLGLSVEEMLRSEASLDTVRLDSLIQEAVEAAVLEMFTWPSGDFSFDVRSEPESGDPQLILRTGVNAQYLAMEGMRIRDEADRGALMGAVDPEKAQVPSIDELSAEEMFGVEPSDPSDESMSNDVDCAPSDANSEMGGAESEAGAEPLRVHARPLILIDPDVAVLEWVKQALQGEFRQVHVFQQAEQGLKRIRQYLIRGELPVVLISPEAEVDPLSGIRGLGDFVKRLKAQAVKLPIFGLIEGEGQPTAGPQGNLDGVLARPPRKLLRETSKDSGDSPARSLSSALAVYLRR